MVTDEIKAADLDAQKFIDDKINEIRFAVKDGLAITALSGGVDSSVVTMLGHRALEDRLTAYFIDNGLMRIGEPERVADLFESLGVHVFVVDAKNQFFDALRGKLEPEEKREAITQTFYRDVFGELVKKSGANFLLQGTILTDVEETVAGIKRQHNVLAQLGIDTEEAFGYTVIEPLIQLRKDGVRMVAQALGLPKSVYNRMPFPGPALSIRVTGEANPESIDLVRRATVLVEDEFANTGAFQYFPVLHNGERVTGICNGKRVFGYQVEVRCFDSVDARTATPTNLPHDLLLRLAKRITSEISEVVSVTYNVTGKPPSTIEIG